MKIIITERQLKKMLKKTLEKEIEEQETAEPKTTGGKTGVSSGIEGVTSKGTSSTQPEVGVWETQHNITRGIANAAGETANKKWGDQIKITRGVANQLK